MGKLVVTHFSNSTFDGAQWCMNKIEVKEKMYLTYYLNIHSSFLSTALVSSNDKI